MKRIILLAALLGPGLALGADTITLKMGDNQPDRTNTWGAVVETINAEFMKENPGVEIVTESYPDQPYQEKIKIYATAKQLPDVFKYWSFSSLLEPMVKGGQALALDRKEFEKHGYLPGALDSNVYGGKLYGIPVSGDLWVIYYNKKLFQEAGVDKVPATLDEKLAEINRTATRQLGFNGWLAGDNVRDMFTVQQIGGINPANDVSPLPQGLSHQLFCLTAQQSVLGKSDDLRRKFPVVRRQGPTDRV